MTSWEIIENLPNFGGEVCFYPKTYFIKKYYPGPDRRYKGEHITIKRDDIQKYVRDLELSWSKFERMIPEFRSKTGITTPGFGNSTIYINYYGLSGITEYGCNGLIANKIRLINIRNEIKSLTLMHLQTIKKMNSISL